MHAARFWREFIHQTRRAPKPVPDLARTPVGALGAAFELGLIRQVLAEPAAETRPAIQDGALAMASSASEPLPLAAERCRYLSNLDALVDGSG